MLVLLAMSHTENLQLYAQSQESIPLNSGKKESETSLLDWVMLMLRFISAQPVQHQTAINRSPQTKKMTLNVITKTANLL